MGRPKTTEPRNRQIKFCLTASELESIRYRAAMVGMRPANFGRALILAGRNAPTSKRQSDNTLQRLIYSQLVRLGNNLNQLLRHLHATGDPIPADLEPLLVDIRQIIAKGYGDDR